MDLHNLKAGTDNVDIEALKNYIRSKVNNQKPERAISLPSASTTRQDSAIVLGNKMIPLDQSIQSASFIRKAGQAITSLPLLGSVFNWTYKVFSLPVRFYALQQDFSNRAAWLDQHGDHLRQNVYHITSRQTLTERSHLNLEQFSRQLEVSLKSLQSQFAQIQKQIESRVTEDARKHTQLEQRLAGIEQIQQKLENDLSKALQAAGKQNALETHLQQMKQQIALIKTDLYSPLEPPADEFSWTSLSAESEHLDIERLKNSIRQTVTHRIAGKSNREFPLRNKLLELQQEMSSLNEKHKHLNTEFSAIASQVSELRLSVSQQSETSRSQEEKLTELSNQIESRIKEVSNLVTVAEEKPAQFEYLQKLFFDLSNHLKATDEVLEDTSQQVGLLSAQINDNVRSHEMKAAELSDQIKIQLESARLNDQHFQAEFGTIRTKVEEVHQEVISAVNNSIESRQTIFHELEEFRMRILRSERRWKQFQIKAETTQPEGYLSKPVLNGNGGSEKKNSEMPSDFDYFLFEHRFRGSRELIKQRQGLYAEFFSGRQAVLDLGCGRGEFLEILKECGISATGIDCNEDMIDLCLDKGLNVINANLLSYLQSIPDRSIDGAFSAQVIEHLSPRQLFLLLALLSKKLQPGAPLLIETVNTNCQMALSNFFLDPTHVRPVPPDMLRYMCEQNQLVPELFIFSSPSPTAQVEHLVKAPVQESIDTTQHLDYALLTRPFK